MAVFFRSHFFWSRESRHDDFFWIYGGLQILVDNILVGNNVESHQVEDEVFMEIDNFFVNLIEFLQNSSVRFFVLF